MISIGVVETIKSALITFVEVKPKQIKVLNKVGPVKIIRKNVKGCFLILLKTFIDEGKQKGVKMIKSITHRQKPRDKGEIIDSVEASLPTIKFPDQNKEARQSTIAALRELLNCI